MTEGLQYTVLHTAHPATLRLGHAGAQGESLTHDVMETGEGVEALVVCDCMSAELSLFSSTKVNGPWCGI